VSDPTGSRNYDLAIVCPKKILVLRYYGRWPDPILACKTNNDDDGGGGLTNCRYSYCCYWQGFWCLGTSWGQHEWLCLLSQLEVDLRKHSPQAEQLDLGHSTGYTFSQMNFILRQHLVWSLRSSDRDDTFGTKGTVAIYFRSNTLPLIFHRLRNVTQ